jgi:hypothetical protein
MNTRTAPAGAAPAGRRPAFRPGLRTLSGLALAAALIGAPCAFGLEAARMALPPELDGAALRWDATGFGGHNRGRYALGDTRGEFTRGESRLGVFDPLYVANQGASTFTVLDLDDSVWLSADCRFSRRTVTVDVITFDSRQMAYECEFTEGHGGSAGRLAMAHPKPKGLKERMLAQDRRIGEAKVRDHVIGIESSHRYRGSKFDSQAPVGYVLSAEGRVVAAVDLLDWNPILFLLEDIPEDLGEAVTVTALALAVLRDPANSALED